jgi:hypothetical protein
MCKHYLVVKTSKFYKCVDESKNVSYLEDVIEYLRRCPEPDRTIEREARILDHALYPHQREFPQLVQHQRFAKHFPKDLTLDAKIVYSLNGNGHPAMKEWALQSTNRSVYRALTSLDKAAAARRILADSKYDIEALIEAEEVFAPELEKWKQDNTYYIPVREFFDNKPQAPVASTEIREPRKPLRDAAKKALEHSFNIAGYLTLPLQLLRSFLPESIGENLRTTKDDFNKKRQEWRSRAGTAASSAINSGKESYQKFRDRNLIATIDGYSADFYASYLIAGTPDKHMDSGELLQSGALLLARDIPCKKVGSIITSLVYRKESVPRDESRLLVPFNYSFTAIDGMKIHYNMSAWDFDAIAQQDVDDLILPADFITRIEQYRNENVTNEFICSEIKNSFQYKLPKSHLNLTRFEGAARTKLGVCQDVNYLLFYTFRKLHRPSFLLAGFQPDGNRITTDDGHVITVARDELTGTWSIYDATPGIKERWEFQTSRIKKTRVGRALDRTTNALIGLTTPVFRGGRKVIAGGVQLAAKYSRLAAMTLQQAMYKDLLDDLRKYSEATSQSVYEADYSKFEDEHKALAERNAERELRAYCHLDNIGIWDDQTFRIDPRFRISGLFSPSDVRKAVHNLKYYSVAFPEYLKRFDKLHLPVEMIEEVVQKGGYIHPVSSSDAGWRRCIHYLFALAAFDEVPPSPGQTSEPVLGYLNPRKFIQVYNETTNSYDRIEQPERIRPRMLRSREFFIASDEEYTFATRILTLFKVDQADWSWYHPSTTSIEVSPVERYQYSPQILSFDKKRSRTRDQYWHSIAQIISTYAKSREHSGQVVHDTILNARYEYQYSGTIKSCSDQSLLKLPVSRSQVLPVSKR